MHNYRLRQPTINGKKSRNWYVIWVEDSETCRVSTGHVDRLKAMQWLEQFKAIQNKPKSRYCLSDIFDGYQFARIEEGAISGNIITSLKPIRAFFGQKTPELVLQGEIRAYISLRKKTVTVGTYARELATLRASLNWAVSEGWIPSFTRFKIPSGRVVRKRFLSRGEFSALYNTANTIRMKIFLSIAINTASRSKKIYQLKWSDIDVERRVMYFSEGTSNKRTRPVPINTNLAWMLGIAKQFAVGEYVVERNGKSIKSISGQFEDTVRRAGLSDINIHDLRRTAASWILQGGVSMEVVAKLLGDSVEVVERHYGHFATGHIKGATDLITWA